MSTRLPYFKTYDIRGVVPDQINAAEFYKIARSVGEWTGAEEVIVGRDARLSSPVLAEAVMKGLIESGVSVWDLGVVTGPMLNFAVARHRKFGMMITASHNPKEYNGIKFIDTKVEQVYDEKGLNTLEQLVVKGKPKSTGKRGKIHLQPILAEYQDYLAERFEKLKPGPLSVVVDCSNGVGSIPLGVFETLGIQTTILNHVPDGNFPNHGCDTLKPENLTELRQTVKQVQADLGLMFDGDADRVAFVDEKGQSAPMDLIFVLLARQALAKRKGQLFYDLRFSRVVKDEIEKLGGVPVKMRVGNPFYKEAIHRHDDALLAAELSGHIMYRDHFGIDDPLYASLKLIADLSQSGKPLSEHIGAVQRYHGSGEIQIKTDDPQGLIDKAKAKYSDGTVDQLDGVTIDFPDWWFNIRPSHTEPVAKMVIEASTATLLEQRKAELLDLLSAGTRH